MSEEASRQHRLYVTGWIDEGVAYGVYRRNTSIRRDGKKVERAKGVKNKAFQWEPSSGITAAQAAAVTALAALSLLPEGPADIRLTTTAEALELLQAPSEIPAPWKVSPAVHELLRSAELHADDALVLPSPEYVPVLDERLIAERQAQNRISAAGNPAPVSIHVPGAWAADFSGAMHGEVGFAALSELDASDPVMTLPIPGFGASQHGELIAALLAHVHARLAGHERPVVYSDLDTLPFQLRRHRNGATRGCGRACGELTRAMGPQELQRVRTEWISRTSPPMARIDQAARTARRRLESEVDCLWLAEKAWQTTLTNARLLAARPATEVRP